MEKKDTDAIVAKLKKARDAYYKTSEPLMSDTEFDKLEEELKEIDPHNPYFSTVGTSPESDKVKHRIPMLSMNKAKSPEEVWKWIEKLSLSKENPFIVEPKIDGLSASCLYRNGKLIRAATRGDGKTGQNITHTAEFIDDIKKEISFTNAEIEIRGELYLPKNTSYDTEGKPLRNRCVGLINRKDDRSALHHIRFAAYQIISADPGEIPRTEEKKIETLKREGFNSVETRLVSTFDEIRDMNREYLENLRNRWLYETDGLIVMVNDSSLHSDIDSRWIVDHHHHYAIALKPPSEAKETTLKKVEWQVSRMGSLIPVAVFSPVKMGGASLGRASLHNAQFVKELRLVPNDKLLIERANDVIPYVRENLSREEHKEEGFFHPLIPRKCPECGSGVEESGVHIKCTNRECPERKIQNILYWVRMSDMDQVAEGTIRQLFKMGRIEGIGDLYRLKRVDFENLEGFGDKKIENFFKQIEKTRTLTARELISKLGIPLVQKRSLEKLEIRTIEDFYNFDDDSYVIGKNIIQWRENPVNRELLESLISVLKIEETEDGEKRGEVCMTGKGPLSRKELQSTLEQRGYSVTSSVTKSTDYLLTDDPEGTSSKLKKARKEGIPVVTYDQWFKNRTS